VRRAAHHRLGGPHGDDVTSSARSASEIRIFTLQTLQEGLPPVGLWRAKDWLQSGLRSMATRTGNVTETVAGTVNEPADRVKCPAVRCCTGWTTRAPAGAWCRGSGVSGP
jgi:hypothetical protein